MNVFEVRKDKEEGNGYMNGINDRMEGCRRKWMLKIDSECIRGWVMMEKGLKIRWKGMIVKERELREIMKGKIGKKMDEIIDGRRIEVMEIEIEVNEIEEKIRKDDGEDNEKELRKFLIEGWSIEIIDIEILEREKRMGKREWIIRELMRFKDFKIRNEIEREREMVGGKLVIEIKSKELIEE